MKKKWFVIYLLINIGGPLLIYAFAQGIVNTSRIEERDYYDASDSFTFLGEAIPVVLFCLLVNVLWLIKALINLFKRRDYRASLAFVGAVAIWAIGLFGLRLLW